MRFLKFTIENYRAIENATLEINNNRLIPIIGINESGKTTALYAILCFHKQKDSFAPEKDNDGAHLNFESKYYIGKESKACIIKADVLLERKEEVDDIADKLKLPRGGEVEKQLLDHLIEGNVAKTPITLCRELKRATDGTVVTRYFVENIKLTEDIDQILFADTLYEHTPHILYFKTFENEIDFPITIPKTYLEGKDTSKTKEWRDLLQEIFKNATKKTIGEEYSINNFLELENESDKQGSVINAINQQLNDDVMSEWKRLSDDGKAPSDENFGNLSLVIKYNPANKDATPEFRIKVVDAIKGETPKEFNINNRSTGLRWFFNFIIKLKYNFHYKNSGALFLLDEPGSNLHSTAQQGLLNKLSELSKNQSPIIFGTHSEDLLDPDKINVACVKIARRDGQKVHVKSFNKAGVTMNEGAWTPLFRALHLKSGFEKFDAPIVIITEGITDYYFFKMIQAHTSLINKSFRFIPGTGANQLKDLISIAIASSENYLVLLDSDEEGKIAYAKYNDFFKAEEAKKIFLYTTPNKVDKVVLEDFLSENDAKRLLAITEVSSVKNAIVALFHCCDQEIIKPFIQGLDQQTVDNLSKVLSRINTLELTKIEISALN